MAKSTNLSAKFILRGQAIGFSTLLAIMWAMELTGMPQRLFGDPPEYMWMRLLTRSLVLGVIWLIVHLTTKRLLQRLHELEGFLVICSWCRRVGHDSEWLSMEQYFGSKFNTETSHGICPECAERQLAHAPRVERVERPRV
jgi:hypothetical protein